MADRIDIVVPDLGDFSDVEIIEILVSAGDAVQKEDGLITLETDKATMDVPAPADGTIGEITVAIGGTVSSGDVIGSMTVTGDETAADSPDKVTAAEPAGDTVVTAQPVAAEVEMQGGGEQTIEVPDIGDFADVEVIEVHVAPGDTVSVDDGLITLETDKATMDVPSTAAGTIRSVLVSAGDKVSMGSAIAVIDAEPTAVPAPAPTEKPAATTAAAAAPPPSTPPAPPAAPRELPPIDEAGFSRAHASPSVRKLARELGVDLARVKGTGAKNRIIHDDVKAFVKAILTGGGLPSAGPALPAVPGGSALPHHSIVPCFDVSTSSAFPSPSRTFSTCS